MALIRKLVPLTLERDVQHREVEATYSIVMDHNGRKYLQIDTYGSAEREMPGKKSQSLRFTPETIEQLRSILCHLP